jgi:phosphonate transport system substrate-binding protein
MKRRHFISTTTGTLLGGLVSANTLFAQKLERPSRQKTPLVLGVFPRRNIKLTFRLFSPLARHLSDLLGREVRLTTSSNFMQFWQNVQRQRYDIVHFNQHHYILAHQLYGYQVILKNSEQGRATVAGTLMVRKDSGITQVSDLKNRTILFGGGRMAMQSYVAPTWLLQQNGLSKGDYIEKIALNPINAFLSTYHKQADAAGCGDVVIELDAVTAQIDSSQMRILAQTEQLPHLPWAVKQNMPEAERLAIQQSLSQLNNSEQGRAILNNAQLDTLLPATDSDYDAHRNIIRDVYGEDYGLSELK